MGKDKWDSCRWSEVVSYMMEDAIILDDQSENDYQGSVDVFFKVGNYSWCDEGKYGFLSYSYGSCSGCDQWEDEPRAKVMADMLNCFLWIDSKSMLQQHLDNLKDTNPGWEADGESSWSLNRKQRYDAIQAALDKED